METLQTPSDPTKTDSNSEKSKSLLKEQIIDALKTVYDPEIPVNIYDLGLIYEIHINDQNHASIVMTLTAPGCPVAGTMPGLVKNAALTVKDIVDVDVELVFNPPWDKSMMSEVAKLELNWL
ncbi:MAG: SUF system Fe-S cluster assembly protein [Alphaproteobacteria bacterium]|nr:SUF system Fe-S cluster assembly protein [Alphaproteobacteria bacterium]